MPIGAVVLTIVVSLPSDAALASFSADIALEAAGEVSLPLGHASGQVSVSEDTYSFPLLPLASAAATTYTPAGPSCTSPLLVNPSGFGGGTLATGPTGFGGPLRLNGSLMLALLAEAGLAAEILGAPLAIGVQASPVARAFTTSPATSAPPAQAFLTLSYSRWTTANRQLTGTLQGEITDSRSVGGSLLSTAAGGQVITVVSPMHVRITGLDASGVSRQRTLALVGRMTITVPAPDTLAAQATIAITLVLIGACKRQSRVL